jgi:hypothetical protein
MAKMNNGILDDFSGKIGKVVGSKWRGVSYMRAQSKKCTGALSEAQLEQQAKFALAGTFSQSMNDLLTLGFKDQAIKMTGKNYGQSLILKEAITGTYPNFQIDYSKVLLSQGKLPRIKKPVTAPEANGILRFTWTNDAGTKLAKANDQAILIAYCPEENETEYAFGPARDAGTGTLILVAYCEALNKCIYTAMGPPRTACKAKLEVAAFRGQAVHTWLSFITADGMQVADSIYTGKVIVDR